MTIRKARWSQRWSQLTQRPQHFHLTHVPVIGLDDGLLLLILELARSRSQIWPRPRAKEFKTSGSMGIWLFRGSNNHPSAWRGDSVSSLSIRAPNSHALRDWRAETEQVWEEGGQLVRREEDEEELGRKKNKARGVEHMPRKCPGPKQKYREDRQRCTTDQTVGAVANQHQLHSTGILSVPHGLLFLSPDLGHIPVWHHGFVFWPSPTWSWAL